VDRAGFEPATSHILDQLLCQAGVHWPTQHTKLNYRPNPSYGVHTPEFRKPRLEMIMLVNINLGPNQLLNETLTLVRWNLPASADRVFSESSEESG